MHSVLNLRTKQKSNLIFTQIKLTNHEQNHNHINHSMGIINARLYVDGQFFWDERAETLEDRLTLHQQKKKP